MTALLVDGNNLLARAHHAAIGNRVEMSVDGVNTGALVLFINLLSKYVHQVKPTHMLVCWDKGHEQRDKIYPEYKGNREKHSGHDDDPETPWAQARQFLTFAGVPQLSRVGWEADDLIAVGAANGPKPVVILSGDKDLLQLVADDVTQIRIGTTPEHWDVERVARDMAMTPTQIPLYMALVGDTSDNIPGVRGIGPKKAVTLLEKVGWDWSALLEELGPEKASDAITARRLVDLRDPAFAAYADDFFSWLVPAPTPEFIPVTPGDWRWPLLEEFIEKWRLASVSQRLKAGTLWQDDPAEPSTEGALEAFSGFGGADA